MNQTKKQGFLSDVVYDLENIFLENDNTRTRVFFIRTGIVIGPGGE